MLDRIVTKLVEGLVLLAASVIVAVVTIEVVLRYLFGLSLIVTEELARYLMVWVVFLGAALGVRDDSHIRINAFVNLLPAQVRRVINVGAALLVLVFCCIVMVEGVRILPEQLQQDTTTLGVSMFWFYLAIPVGCLLMIGYLLHHLWRALTPRLQGRRAGAGGRPC